MSEEKTIDMNKCTPNTISSLINDFKKLGINEGMTLLVHTSLSSLGWVCGGAATVILALEKILTDSGTLVMPTHSGDYSDPSHWSEPAVPETWWEIIRSEMPCFQKDLTPTRKMGKIAETFRKQDGVLRSSHPSASFAAWGKYKEYIIQDQHYDYSQNDKSPLGRIYEKNGHILLLGVNYNVNTSFHLAEYRANFKGKQIVKDGFPILNNNKKEWKYFEDILYKADDFMEIGNSFEKQGIIKTGFVGDAKAKLINQKELVDYAVEWMEKNRFV